MVKQYRWYTKGNILAEGQRLKLRWGDFFVRFVEAYHVDGVIIIKLFRASFEQTLNTQR